MYKVQGVAAIRVLGAWATGRCRFRFRVKAARGGERGLGFRVNRVVGLII